MKLPIISLAILGGQAFLANSLGGNIFGKLDIFQSLYTGVQVTDGTFHPERLVVGYAPWLAKRFIMPIARVRIPSGMHLPVSLS